VSGELLEAGLPPAQDRLLTTCFLAALLHVIIILGVTFSPSQRAAGGAHAHALQVILVSDRTPAAAANPDAAYLAQRNQHGAGNTLAHERARIPKSSPAPIDHAGLADANALRLRRHGERRIAGGDAVIATSAPVPRIRYFAAGAASAAAAAMPILLKNRPDFGMRPNADGVELRLRGKRRRQLWIAADTRAADVAEYLDGWRRHVERIGTVNFPSAARLSGPSGTPIVQVTIDADGRLAGMRVSRSSGNPAIDEAAIRILRLAAPFAPFPRKLAAKHDQIRIAYQWEFLAGAARGPAVFYAPPPPARARQGTRKGTPAAR